MKNKLIILLLFVLSFSVTAQRTIELSEAEVNEILIDYRIASMHYDQLVMVDLLLDSLEMQQLSKDAYVDSLVYEIKRMSPDLHLLENNYDQVIKDYNAERKRTKRRWWNARIKDGAIVLLVLKIVGVIK